METVANHRYPAQVIAAVSVVKMLRRLPAPNFLTVTEVSMENKWDGIGVPPVGTEIIHASEIFQDKTKGIVVFSRENDFVCDFNGRLGIFYEGDKEVIPFDQKTIDENESIRELTRIISITSNGSSRITAELVYKAVQSGEIPFLKITK